MDGGGWLCQRGSWPKEMKNQDADATKCAKITGCNSCNAATGGGGEVAGHGHCQAVDNDPKNKV